MGAESLAKSAGGVDVSGSSKAETDVATAEHGYAYDEIFSTITLTFVIFIYGYCTIAHIGLS